MASKQQGMLRLGIYPGYTTVTVYTTKLVYILSYVTGFMKTGHNVTRTEIQIMP